MQSSKVTQINDFSPGKIDEWRRVVNGVKELEKYASPVATYCAVGRLVILAPLHLVT